MDRSGAIEDNGSDRKTFGPVTFTADPRVGGKYPLGPNESEGEEMTVHGEYRELVPGKKIVFTWQWDDDEDLGK